MTAHEQTTRIAWCGWRLTMPADWRPMRIRGDENGGTMMIGDATTPVLLVQWSRPRDSGPFDAAAWMAARLAKLGGQPEAVPPPRTSGVTVAAWARDVRVRENQSKTVWYGYGEAPRLMVEVTLTSLTPAPLREQALAAVLPGLEMESSPGTDRQWWLHEVGFVSPAGFALRRRHLYAGDVALAFARGSRETLMVRQVYPAGLALSRRKLATWMDTPPFLDRRHWRGDAPEARTWPAARALSGVRRRGWKRLAAPLGWCAPRYNTAAAAVDAALDRLLLVDHQDRAEHGYEVVDRCLERMNGP